MVPALAMHVLAIPWFALNLFLALPSEGWRYLWKRIPLFLVVWTAFTLLTLMHVIGHLCDEILFRSYRKVTIDRPVFILGIPRSGTTYLQRLLGSEEQFTTFATWEVFFAPSISERWLYKLLGQLLSPLQAAWRAVRHKLFSDMDKIHRIHLLEPEEDFLLLVPLQACLLLVFLCPSSAHYRRLGYFDEAFSPFYKNLVMTYYKLCLRKHLAYHGKEKRLLSKNPSFTPMTHSLMEYFPDAKLIACTRAPAEVIPSQLSSLRPAMQILGKGVLSAQAQDRMINLLHHYYKQIESLRADPHVLILPMTQLQSALKQSMAALFDFLGTAHDSDFHELIEAEDASTYRSSHDYDLSEFTLTENVINEKFRDVWPPSGTAARPESRTT